MQGFVFLQVLRDSAPNESEVYVHSEPGKTRHPIGLVPVFPAGCSNHIWTGKFCATNHHQALEQERGRSRAHRPEPTLVLAKHGVG